MCGLFGMISEDIGFGVSDADLIKPFSLITSLRGEHSTGYMSMSSYPLDATKFPEVTVMKEVGHAYNVWETDEYKKFIKDKWRDQSFFFGHGRHATVGAHTKENAHPFEYKNIVLMHNGTIRSGLPNGQNTDSERCAQVLADKGLQELIDTAQGAYVFFWFDKDDYSFNLIKNNQRPLACMKVDGIRYFASEWRTLAFIYDRELKSSYSTQSGAMEEKIAVVPDLTHFKWVVPVNNKRAITYSKKVIKKNYQYTPTVTGKTTSTTPKKPSSNPASNAPKTIAYHNGGKTITCQVVGIDKKYKQWKYICKSKDDKMFASGIYVMFRAGSKKKKSMYKIGDMVKGKIFDWEFYEKDKDQIPVLLISKVEKKLSLVPTVYKPNHEMYNLNGFTLGEYVFDTLAASGCKVCKKPLPKSLEERNKCTYKDQRIICPACTNKKVLH